MKYLIRYTAEHTLLVDADNAMEALEEARNAPADDWEKTTGEYEVDDDYDPTPWCRYCNAMRREDCDCGPIPDND